jgi:ribosome maturation factor RimP
MASGRERDESPGEEMGGAGGSPLEARIEALLTEPVAALGVRLLEARLVQEGRWVLRLVVDKPPIGGVVATGEAGPGVTLDECARVSELASRILDVEDPIPHAFTLEVSSPGVFRPLKTRRHFEQALGRWIRLTLGPDALPERKDRTFGATVMAVEGEILQLDDKGAAVTVLLAQIKKARLDPDL